MKPMTIKTLKIGQFRGFKEAKHMFLDDQSVIVYGDNGTGKSSITDAIEWFFHGRVEHLSGNEISKEEAFRNVFDEGRGSVEMEFFDPSLNSKRSLGETPANAFSNSESRFKEFREAASAERFWLRYRDLGRFVLAKPADRFRELLEIIGFGEVSKLRTLLRQKRTRLGKEADAAHVQVRKAQLQRDILECLGQNAHTVEQFLSATESLIKPFQLGIDVVSLEAVEELLAMLSKRFDSSAGAESDFLTRAGTVIEQISNDWNVVRSEYGEYYGLIQELLKDPSKLESLEILGLLQKGLHVLEKDLSDPDVCPLCQQNREKSALIAELKGRIEEKEDLERLRKLIEEKRDGIINKLESSVTKIILLLDEAFFAESKYGKLRTELETAKCSIETVIQELDKGISAEICSDDNLPQVEQQVSGALSTVNALCDALVQSQSGNQWFEIHSKIDRALRALREYLRINREQEQLRVQCRTFQILHDHLAKKQEDALKKFFAEFSGEINDYYTTINPDEEISNIALTPTEKNGEFTGVTLQYSFAGRQRTQPVAHLSESHLNCLGLAFFLASVRAFNKQTGFIVLDDIVAGFDREHRDRLADLLMEKFSDYQVLLLTHNREFYDSIRGKLEQSKWRNAELTWTGTDGTIVSGCQY